MDRKELEIARKELKQAVASMNFYEMARIIGTPLDPRKPVADVINLIADKEPDASPDEYLFYFDVNEDVKYVYALAHDGTVTKVDVTVNSPNAITFTKTQSPVYNIQIVDLNSAKFDVIAKKRKAVTNALDNKEVYDVLNIALAAATSSGNTFTLDSGKSYLDFPKILEMYNAIAPYGDNYVLIVGSTVDSDIVLTDYRENKNQSVLSMLDKLNIKRVKITGTVKVDGSDKEVLDPNKAILVATSTLAGKPLSFGRKKLVPGTAINSNIDPKLRLNVVVPAIPKNGESPSVGVWGYGEIQCVAKNSKAVASFERV